MRVRVEQPSVPVAMNADGKLHQDARDIQAQLALQLDHAVQWVGCLTSLKEAGCAQYVECGSGRVLSGLIKRWDKSFSVYSTETAEALQEAASTLAAARKGSI
jgi:[acyl-carrier-protein] S-malonyltransferase